MMKKSFKHLSIFCGLLLSMTVNAAPSSEIDCLIEPNMTIELSSPVTGVLDTILVDRSDMIKKGQVVATLKADVVQVKVKTSQEKVNLSQAESKRAIDLYAENVITLSEKEQSDHELKINQLELEQIEATLELHRIRSPIDAVVADRYRMPGEFVEDKPILKIAQLDPLRVEIISSVENFGQIEKGMHAHVITDFGNYSNLVAEVVLVDRVIDAASGTFGIRLELPNKENKIPGGLKCKVRFFSSEEEAAYTSEPSAENTLDGQNKKTQSGTAEYNPDFVTEAGAIQTCHSIGPFRKKAQLQAVINKLDNNISDFNVQDKTATSAFYLVSTKPSKTIDEARALMLKIKQSGINDIALLKRKAGASISFGLFTDEQTANARKLKLSKIGFDSRVTKQNLNRTVYWADVVSNKLALELKQLVGEKGVISEQNLDIHRCSVKI